MGTARESDDLRYVLITLHRSSTQGLHTTSAPRRSRRGSHMVKAFVGDRTPDRDGSGEERLKAAARRSRSVLMRLWYDLRIEQEGRKDGRVFISYRSANFSLSWLPENFAEMRSILRAKGASEFFCW